ncbi:MAG TPA: GntR family transcriptional regulator [Actinomadura sp.]|nr:GntR family transcriptional regulator [Actinomadura sp.]
MSTPAGPSSVATGSSAVRPVAVRSGKRLAPVIYDLIKERLLGGGYQAGERLAVESLKAEFEVSKQPIMDGLRRLATDGLVEIIPQVGCHVPVYEAAEVEDFFAIFAGLEGAVAGVAAQRRTETQLAELEQANRRIAELVAEDDPGARSHGYRVLNREFHVVVHAMAHSRVMAQISRRMWDMSDLLINTTGGPQPLAEAVSERLHDHEGIIAALREQDTAAARAEMEAHILGTVDLIHLPRTGSS